MAEMGNPGHPDLILAEFQAKARAGVLFRQPDPAEEKTRRGAGLIARLVIVAVAAALVITNYNDWRITAAVVPVVTLVVVAEIWLWRRRSRAETGELTELGEPD